MPVILRAFATCSGIRDSYELGDEHRLTGWVSYSFADAVSGSLRL